MSRFCYQVVACHLVIDPHTMESRGFGFVTMETVEDADQCIKQLNRSVLEGRLITVEKVLVSIKGSNRVVWLFISRIISSKVFLSLEMLPD